MSDTYEINEFDEVVPYNCGRRSNDTRTWRDATELELSQREEIKELEERSENAERENAELKQLIKEQEEMSCKLWVKIPNLVERFNAHGEDYRLAIKELLSELYLFEAAKWVRDHANASSSSSSSSHIVI